MCLINKTNFKVHKDTKENLTWEQARTYCESLGDDWRLPTRLEVLFMYENREEQDFPNGTYYTNVKGNASYVRAVKDIN